MAEFEQLYGTIESIIYYNEENGYSVIKVRDYNDQYVTVVGCFPNPAIGEEIDAYGTWKDHSNYGLQFSCESCERYLPNDAKSIFNYLANGAIKGIGPAIAQEIVSRFGESSLDVISNSPEKLTQIRGISLSKAKEISEIFNRNTYLRQLLEYLFRYSIKPYIAMRLYKVYGDNCLEKIKINPYILVDDNIGGSFKDADIIAMSEGFSSDDIYRIRAASIYELKHNQRNGHCFIPLKSLIEATAMLLKVDLDIVSTQIDELINNKVLIKEKIKDIEAVYLPVMYEAELYVSQKLLEIKEKVFIITGGPGTGKTTLIKSILDEKEKQSLKCLLVAPTGRAAKRIEETTGRQASTIHRLLGVNFSDDGNSLKFSKNENDKLVCDYLILDECSMVDILLMEALLKALPDNSNLILVGDVDQLPPVGPGNVFKAAIESNAFKTEKLCINYRQKEDSLIVDYANKINNGLHPDFSINANGFFRLKRIEAGSTIDTICELFSRRLPEKMNIEINDIQVLTPSRKGELGCVNLNKQLQNVLNPQSPEKKEKIYGECIYREGDKVIQIRNNYDITWHNNDMTEFGLGIFNGDIGYIKNIDIHSQTLIVDFEGRIVSYSFELLGDIEHAWAITVHKSQGSEYKAVLLALNGINKMLMTRQILYTAVTRAIDLLIMVGDEDVANFMIDNVKKTVRYSFLCQRIRNGLHN